LLFPFEEQYKLYRKPWEVLSLANFANYSQDFDYENFPAVKLAKGYEVILDMAIPYLCLQVTGINMEYIDAVLL